MDYFIPTVVSGFFVAAASGLIGSFLVLRKMTLLSDALSHVALPGIALGVVLNFEPLWGGLLFLFLGILAIWGIENKTRLAVESITGVLFVTALAAGALLIEEHDLLEAFFGDVSQTNLPRLAVQSVIALAIIVFTLAYRKRLTLFSIAPDLSRAHRISARKMELLLLSLIALTISIGISFVGILLMSALSIIPAVTARNLARTYNEFVSWSVGLAVVFLTAGLLAAKIFLIPPGIATVLLSAFVFGLSLLRKK